MELEPIWRDLEQAWAQLDALGDVAFGREIAELRLEAPWFNWFAAAALFGSEPFSSLLPGHACVLPSRPSSQI